MNHLPIRIRLTVAFIVSVALVLAITSAFIYLRMAADLSNSIDQGLRARAQDLAGTIRTADGALRATSFRLLDPDEVYAQILTRDGSTIDASSALGNASVLSLTEIRHATDQTILLDRRTVPGQDGPSRALATPITLTGQSGVLVVGVTLSDRDEALASLRNKLLIGGPIALLLLSLGGYFMSRAALKPIDMMRRRAEELSTHHPDERLPVAAAHDEVRELGLTLNAMLDRLQGAFVRERRLLTDAGHEIRTPLALLKTELEVALRENGGREELRASMRSAIEETDRLSQLADNLLVFTQADGGGLPRLPPRVDASAAVDLIQARFSPIFARAGRSLTVDAPAGQWVRADSLQLEQVLGNMLDNALGHGAGLTRLEVGTAGRLVQIHVLDNGPGLPADILTTAFEPFARANEARSRPGAGLGLAIIRRIVESWGGTAQIANHPDGGADVSIALPAVPEPE